MTLPAGRLGRALAVALLVALGFLTPARAHAQPSDAHRPATWNIQGGRDRWLPAYGLTQSHDVVALQEVPDVPPAAARPTGRSLGAIEEYVWQEGSRGRRVYLYILRTASRNLGVITTWRADDAAVIPGPYRPLLAVVNYATDTVFASVHASANGGGDARTLVRNAADWAQARRLSWAVIGDFNRPPEDLVRPAGSFLYNAAQPTQRSLRELDYMVASLYTDNWQASVLVNRGSDHWPVGFSSMRAAAGPRTVTVSSLGNGGLLDVRGGSAANGTSLDVYRDNGGTNQRWQIADLGVVGERVYRIVSALGNGPWCVDVQDGLSSRLGSFNNIWRCHATNGLPETEHWWRDTQNFDLVRTDIHQPNRIMFRDHSTGYYLNVLGGGRANGTLVGQWTYQPASNEYFYLHPVE